MSTSTSHGQRAAQAPSRQSVTDALACMSVVQPHREHNSECGYCKGSRRDRWSYGMSALRLTAADYQALCDAGFRRSGTYVYKPTNDRSCCPNITIRLDVTQFKADKSQNKLVQRFNRFLRGEIDLLAPKDSDAGVHANASSSSAARATQLAGTANAADSGSNQQQVAAILGHALRQAITALFPGAPVDTSSAQLVVYLDPAKASTVAAHATRGLAGPPQFSSSVAFQVRAALMKAARVHKQKSAGTAATSDAAPAVAAAAAIPTAGHIASTLAYWLQGNVAAALSVPGTGGSEGAGGDGAETQHQVAFAAAETGQINIYLANQSIKDPVTGAVVRIRIPSTVQPGHGRSHGASSGTSAITADAQITASGVAAAAADRIPARKKSKGLDDATAADAARAVASGAVVTDVVADTSAVGAATTASGTQQQNLRRHSFRVEMVPAAFEKESHKLYQKYQMAVHGDSKSDCTAEQYERFLCDNPFVADDRGAPVGCNFGMRAAGASSGSGARSTSDADSHSSPPNPDSKLVAALVSLGFPQQQVETALAACRNNPEKAYKRLLRSAQKSSSRSAGAGDDDAVECEDDDDIGWESAPGTLLEAACGSERKAWLDGEDGGAGLPLTIDAAASAAGIASPSAAGSAGAGSGGGGASQLQSSTSKSAAVAAAPWVHGFRDGPDYVFPDLLDHSHNPQSASAPAEPCAADATDARTDTSTQSAGTALPSSSQPAPATSTAAEAPAGTDLGLGYGAFHQKYYLDNKLIAVAVIDVLPHCLSSVYVFYDPTLPHLELGKLTALREIQWVQASMARASPRLKYYYMGFYVHSCQKMRYKAGYKPTDIQCPVTSLPGRPVWVPLDQVAHRLDVNKVALLASFSPDAAAGEDAASTTTSEQAERAAHASRKKMFDVSCAAAVGKIPICLGDQDDPASLVSVKDLDPRSKPIATKVLMEFLGKVGPGLGTRMVVKLQ